MYSTHSQAHNIYIPCLIESFVQTQSYQVERLMKPHLKRQHEHLLAVMLLMMKALGQTWYNYFVSTMMPMKAYVWSRF